MVLNQKNSMRGENRLYFFRIRTTVSPTSRNGPWAVPKSSESSYTETFSLQKFKNGDTCSPFLSICRANAISCALPREMLKNADYTTFRQTEGLEFSLKSFFHTVTKRHFSRQAEWNARCRANRLALRHMHLSADKNGQTALVCPLYFYSPQPGQSEQSPHSVPSAALRSS